MGRGYAEISTECRAAAADRLPWATVPHYSHQLRHAMPNMTHIVLIAAITGLMINPARSEYMFTTVEVKPQNGRAYTMESYHWTGNIHTEQGTTTQDATMCNYKVAYRIYSDRDDGVWTCNNIDIQMTGASCYNYLKQMVAWRDIQYIYPALKAAEARYMTLEVTKNKQVIRCGFYNVDPDAKPPKPPVSCRIDPGEAIVIGPLKNTDTVSGRTSITLNCTAKASVRVTAGDTGGAAQLTYAKGGKLNLKVEGGTTSKPNSAIHAVVRGDNIPLDVTATTVPGTANPGSYSASIIVTAEVL